MILNISALTKAHDRSGFLCSDEEVDLFLKHKALQDQKLDLSRTYVLTDNVADRCRIIGYFTVTPIHVRQEVILNDRPRIKREIPALLLGQLGVDKEFQKRGFGEILLINAESKALMASDLVGLRAMILDARNEDLAAWYSGYGYSRVGIALRMAKNIEVIRLEHRSSKRT
jgi:ribosomal protein S18 acetylase RimI-like enzyme